MQQNAKLVLEISQHGYMMVAGRVAINGPVQGLLSDERVRSAYLGG